AGRPERSRFSATTKPFHPDGPLDERPAPGRGDLMNRSIGELARLLDAAEAVVLTTHSGPDGDGLGCLVALREALEARGKRVLALLPDPLGSRYRFLDPQQRMVVVDDVQEDRASY